MVTETDAARLLQGVRRHFDFCHDLNTTDWLTHRTQVSCQSCEAASRAEAELHKHATGLVELVQGEKRTWHQVEWTEVDEGEFETTLIVTVDHGC